MVRYFSLFVLAVLIGCDKTEPDGCELMPVVDGNLIKTTVETLAADDMYGRWTKQGGILKAQSFLESKMAEVGLEKFQGSYKQSFNELTSTPAEIKVTLNGVSIEQSKLAINPSGGSGLYNSQYEVVKFTASGSFRQQSNDFLKDLFDRSITNRRYVILVPEVHAAEFAQFKKWLKGLTMFRRTFMVTVDGFTTFFGDSDILYILTNQTAVTSLDGTYQLGLVPFNNLAGILPGKSKADEIVLFSAHYDHLGVMGSQPDSIANGANDNASGVAGILALAEYYKRTGDHERTLWFVFFNAEEAGVLGSEHFASSNYTGKIKTMLNLDMIGNPIEEENGVAYLTGFASSNVGQTMQMNTNCEAMNILTDAGFTSSLHNRSDQAPFIRRGLLAAHMITTFNNDNYEQYHSLDDEIDKIDVKIIEKVVSSVIMGTTSFVK